MRICVVMDAKSCGNRLRRTHSVPPVAATIASAALSRFAGRRTDADVSPVGGRIR